MVDARRVALFWPITRLKEVDLRAADSALRERGVTVAYPAIEADSRVMRFHVVDDVSELTDSELGFMAPPSTAPIAESLDVVVVPGLAFDSRGYRIGYGGGFYDQALPRCRPPAVAVGVAFDFQLAADIPFDDEYDIPVDVVVTDRRVLRTDPAEDATDA
jgi:5-formyltetrahydrofolate cyclo-ligase